MKRLLIAGYGELARRAVAALGEGRILPARVVYVSTPALRTARAVRRFDAERPLALWCSGEGLRHA